MDKDLDEYSSEQSKPMETFGAESNQLAPDKDDDTDEVLNDLMSHARETKEKYNSK